MTDSPVGGLPSEGLGAEWPKKAADAVDLVVDTIHDKAIRPIMLAARVVVFGLLIAALGLVVLVLLSVGLLRLLDVYAFGGRVWISYAVLGGVFTLAGLLAWTKRMPRTATPAGHD
ncbi:MAG TPA: hypothetical protein VHW47_05805 [Acidimicrobiales bacterium]|nr:hypothetical protein [Acidimicrobiales bacterium]